MALELSKSQATVKRRLHSQSLCKITKLSHTWTIDHMSYHCEPNLHLPDYLQSSNFSPHKFNPERTQFYVKLYPRGDSQGGNGVNIQNAMSLYLHLESNLRDSQTVSFKVAILSATGDKNHCKELTQDLSPGSKCGWQDYVLRDNLLKDIKEDTCTISIEVVLHGGMSHQSVVEHLELPGEEKHTSSNQVVGQTAKSFTLTSWQMISLSHDWTVSNFNKVGASAQVQHPLIASSIFGFPNSKFKFRIHLYPNGDEMDGYISLFLFLISQNENTNIIYKFSLEKSDRGLVSMEAKRRFSKNESRGYTKFLSHTELLNPVNGFLLDDKLTIYLEVTILLGINTISSSNFKQESAQLKQLATEQSSQDLGNLLKKSILCDVTIVIGEKEFSAHKSILSARSDVFAAMFEHDFEEKKNNRVNIEDMEPAAFEQFLHFVYSGKVDNLEDYADDLLMAAEKYQMASLKNLCEHFLISKLTLESLLYYLVLADKHNAQTLKESAIEFISLESASIIPTEAFKDFLKNNLDLGHEVISTLST